MTMKIPFGFEYVEQGVKTDAIPTPHWVVHVSTTPQDALDSLIAYDEAMSANDGEHSIEFIEV